MNELAPLESFAAGLISRLQPAARRTLARELARQLRDSQSKRIAAQQNPDGSPYEPRKPRLRARKGRVRRAMFTKLRTARWMKAQSSPDAAVVSFVGQVQHMASVHQFGLRDRVNRLGGPEVQYPARRLLGFTDADVESIADVVLRHLAG